MVIPVHDSFAFGGHCGRNGRTLVASGRRRTHPVRVTVTSGPRSSGSCRWAARCCRRCVRWTRLPATWLYRSIDQDGEEHHIRSIYSKIGVSSRRCAALPPTNTA